MKKDKSLKRDSKDYTIILSGIITIVYSILLSIILPISYAIFDPTRIPYLLKKGLVYSLPRMMLEYLIYSIFFVLPFGIILGILLFWKLLKERRIIIKSLITPILLSIPYLFTWVLIVRFFFAGYAGVAYAGFLKMVPFLFGMFILLGAIIGLILNSSERKV